MSKANTRATIKANIKQNGNQEITGQVLNSVLNTMVDDYAEQEKLTELESEVSQLGQEVFPKVLANQEGYIDDKGNVAPTPYWRSSDLFIVYPGLEILVHSRIGDTNVIIAFYNAEKEYLKELSPKDSETVSSEYKDRTVIVPEGAYFARFHSAYDAGVSSFAFFYDDKRKDAMTAAMVAEYYYKNISRVIPRNSGFIDENSGKVVPTPYWRSSDLFPVTPGTILMIHSRTNTGRVLVAFYDKYGGYLKEFSPTSTSTGVNYEDNNITVPLAASYAIFHSAYDSDILATCVLDGISILEDSSMPIPKDNWYAFKTVLPMPSFEASGKKIVFFGDSITYGIASCEPSEQYPYGLFRCDNPYAKLLCEKLGLDYSAANNKAISGSRFAGEFNSVPSITDNILSFSEQADIIYIAGGTNDYQTKVPLGSITDTSQETLYGALNNICSFLKTNYPQSMVIFALPINWSKQLNYDVQLNEYRNAIYEVAVSNGFYTIDTSEIGFPKAMTENGTPNLKSQLIYDGVHPTELGHVVMANSLARIIGCSLNEDSNENQYGYDFRTPLTQSTTSTNNIWVYGVINNVKVSKIKFIAQEGTVNFYKVTATELSRGSSVTKELITSVVNSQAEQGIIKEVDVDILLGEHDYIGINGSFCYQYSEGHFEPSFVIVTATDIIDVGLDNNICLGYAGIEIISLENEIRELQLRVNDIREIPDNCVIVDKNGNGDFTNPFDAIVALKGKDTATNPYTILVMPGIYYMPTLPKDKFFTYSGNRYLSIVGLDKVNTILRNDNGYYNALVSDVDNLGDNTPLKLSGNIYIANLTIISTDNDNAQNTDAFYHASYCIHMDDSANEGDLMEVHNCRLVNNHAPCIGFGIPKNATLKITDCDLESDLWNPNNVYGGAVIYGHDRGGSSSEIEEHIFIKNCTFKSINGHAFKSLNNQNALMDCSFVGNACALPTGKGIVLGTHTSITQISFGNSVSDMNYVKPLTD